MIRLGHSLRLTDRQRRFGGSFAGRILYFWGSIGDEDWNNLGNWTMDEAGAMPADALPEAGDRVYIFAPIVVAPTAPITLEKVYVQGVSADLEGVTATLFTVTLAGADLVGSVTGNARVEYPVTVPLSGIITGTITYIGYAQTPTGFGADPGNGEVLLFWASSGIDPVVGLQYRILRGQTADINDAIVLAEGIDGTSIDYQDATAVNDTTYYYWIQVYYANGASAFVGPESATPTSPFTSIRWDSSSYSMDSSMVTFDQT